MRRTLQALAAAVLLGVALTWLALGMNRGWTKTSAPVTTVDEVTGIEAITYEKRFLPGLDFLGAGLLAGALLLGGALFISKPRSSR